MEKGSSEKPSSPAADDMEIWATVLSDSLKGGAFWFSPPTQVSY
jgi:hypothetical protein